MIYMIFKKFYMIFKKFYIISKVCFLMTLHYFISFHLIFVSKIENNTESLAN